MWVKTPYPESQDFRTGKDIQDHSLQLFRDWAPPSVPQSFFSCNWQSLFIPSPASLSLRDTSSISIRQKSLTFGKLQYHYWLEYWKKTGRVRRWQHFSHEKTHFSGHPNLSHKREEQGAGGSHFGLGGSGLNIVPRIVPLLCDESGRFVNSLAAGSLLWSGGVRLSSELLWTQRGSNWSAWHFLGTQETSASVSLVPLGTRLIKYNTEEKLGKNRLFSLTISWISVQDNGIWLNGWDLSRHTSHAPKMSTHMSYLKLMHRLGITQYPLSMSKKWNHRFIPKESDPKEQQQTNPIQGNTMETVLQSENLDCRKGDQNKWVFNSLS